MALRGMLELLRFMSNLCIRLLAIVRNIFGYPSVSSTALPQIWMNTTYPIETRVTDKSHNQGIERERNKTTSIEFRLEDTPENLN